MNFIYIKDKVIWINILFFSTHSGWIVELLKKLINYLI